MGCGIACVLLLAPVGLAGAADMDGSSLAGLPGVLMLVLGIALAVGVAYCQYWVFSRMADEDDDYAALEEQLQAEADADALRNEKKTGPDAPVTIMDGSMGRQLCLDGLPQDDLFRQIWSARALADASYHQLVVDAHISYITAGATVLVRPSRLIF